MAAGAVRSGPGPGPGPGPGRLALALGLALGAAGAGLGLLWMLRRRRRPPWPWRRGGGREAEPAGHRSQVVPRAVGAVEAGDAPHTPLLPRDEPLDVLQRLDLVLRNIAELRGDVEELRGSLQRLAAEILGQVRSHLEETQRVTRRRRFPFPRERSDSVTSSSIYFTASSGAATTDDGESEGGYTTANAESDYDRESERASEEGEDEASCAARGSPELAPEAGPLAPEAGPLAPAEPRPEAGLAQVLQQADRLHRGDACQQREAFQLLLNNKLAYAEQKDFVWRLARAHSDMCEITGDADEKRSYAAEGKEELEMALQKWGESAECHQWYAVLCGQLSEHESIQKRIQTGYVFKEHIDKAIELKPEDPKSYYLLGRWCYQVSHLGWLEKKTAAALFEAPPTATVQDALQNFLRVEELSPGFSKAGRVYIAKCYRDLGNSSAAALWLDLAAELPVATKEDAESERELEEMRSAWQQ